MLRKLVSTLLPKPCLHCMYVALEKKRYYSINAAIVSPAIVVHIVWYLFHNHINTISNGVMYLADKKVCCFGYGVSFFPFKIVTKGFRGSFFCQATHTELHIWNGLPLLWGVLMPFLISLVLLVTINQPRLSIWSFPKEARCAFIRKCDQSITATSVFYIFFKWFVFCHQW